MLPSGSKEAVTLRFLLFACPLIVSALVATGPARAQTEEAAGSAEPARSAQPAGSAEPAASKVRRDPRGITGISPFWEALKRGDSAYVARDYDGAIDAYTKALTKEPQNALGHYRVGEAHRAKGDLQQAERAWQAALRFAAGEPVLKAKVLFCLADLRERQKDLQAAKQGWNSYEAHLAGQSKPIGYPKTPTERKERADAWVDLKEKYAAVRERIRKRLEEVERKRQQEAK
jgi:tetratricopeptide (TPR) repeat protein